MRSLPKIQRCQSEPTLGRDYLQSGGGADNADFTFTAPPVTSPRTPLNTQQWGSIFPMMFKAKWWRRTTDRPSVFVRDWLWPSHWRSNCERLNRCKYIFRTVNVFLTFTGFFDSCQQAAGTVFGLAPLSEKSGNPDKLQNSSRRHRGELWDIFPGKICIFFGQLLAQSFFLFSFVAMLKFCPENSGNVFTGHLRDLEMASEKLRGRLHIVWAETCGICLVGGDSSYFLASCQCERFSFALVQCHNLSLKRPTSSLPGESLKPVWKAATSYTASHSTLSSSAIAVYISASQHYLLPASATGRLGAASPFQLVIPSHDHGNRPISLIVHVCKTVDMDVK